MIQNIEKKEKIIKWRLRLLENMQFYLKLYKFGGDEDDLTFAKELGADSEHLSKVLKSMK
jgi:hypothetical protein